MTTKPTEVVVAVAFDKDGRFLMTSRPEGKVYAGYWEFPGGKVEAGETLEEALVREMKEELGVQVTDCRGVYSTVFTYPHATVHLHFLHCRLNPEELKCLEGQTYRFCTLEDLPHPILPVASASAEISRSSSPSIGLSLMEYFPSAHAPRSIKRQRSQQKGRYGFLSEYSHSRPQVGHLTLIAIFTTYCINRGGKASPREFPRSDRCRNWRRRNEPKGDNGSRRSSESYSV